MILRFTSWPLAVARRGDFCPLARLACLALVWLAALTSPAGAAYECWEIPNVAVAAFPTQQAPLWQQDTQIVGMAARGNGVVNSPLGACKVLQAAVPDMTTRITTGCTIVVDGSTASVTTGNFTHSAAHATMSRIDIVSASSTGVKTVTTGTAATPKPAPPTIPDGHVVLAFVTIPAADAAINTNQIVDKRMCVNTPGGGGGAPTGAQYLVGALDGTLSAERIVTDTASITWDLATAAQAKANLAAIPSATPMLGSALATAIAAPGTPAAGKSSVYVDSTTKKLCNKDDAGVVSCTGASGSTPTGTGFPHITAGVQDAAAKLVDAADINTTGVGAGTYGQTTVNTKGQVTAGTVVSDLAHGGTGQATAQLARGSAGLNVESATAHGDSAYTILVTDRAVYTSAAFTAPRTWTLPALSTVNDGQIICVYDLQGTVTGTNTLTVARAGSDLINGATTYVLNAARGSVCLTAGPAGGNGWMAAVPPAGSGTVTSIATTAPITGGTITTTGTIACATCVTSAAALTSGQLVAGAGSQASAVTNLTGDVTTSGGVATALSTTGVGAGTYGQVTVDTKGRVTSATTITDVAHGGTGLASGTSGGIPAYTASGTIASSGALTANLPVIGGGAGVAPTVGTRSGNTTAYVTTTGTQTSGDCVKIDANGNHIANGSACGGGSGPTITTFAAGQPSDASTTFNVNSLTTRAARYFTIGGSVTVNQITVGINTVTTAGTIKVCIYSGDGATKLIDVTTGTPASNTPLSTAVSAVVLAAGEYYAVIGCATTCSNLLFASPVEMGTAAAGMFGQSSPAGKKPWHGVVTHTSGTCNTTLGTVTGNNTTQPVLRGDN